MKLSIAIEKYLATKAEDTRTAGWAYKQYLKHLMDYMGDEELENILEDRLVAFRKNLKNKYQDSNVANHVNVLRNFYEWAYAHSLTKVHPFLIKTYKFIANEQPVFTQEQVDLICSQFDTYKFDELKKLIAIRLMWDSMIRVSELVDLNISQLETSKNYTEIVSKKNYQKRWIMWSPETHELLLRYLGVRICLNQRDELFTTNEGRVTTRQVQRWVKEARMKVGIKKGSCHAFRHGGAHKRAKDGADLKKLGVMLGHSHNNPRAAMQYLRYNKSEQLEVLSPYLS